MNSAQQKTCNLIERCLINSKAFRQIEPGMYVVKQGSCFVMVNVLPWELQRAVVRCVAQLVQGVQMTPELAQQLLELNAVLRFGAFAYVPEGQLILLQHSILGGETLDEDELVSTLKSLALIADEWDDRIAERFGGSRMQDLLQESALARILRTDPEAVAAFTAIN